MKKLRFLCFASLLAGLIICLAVHGHIGLADLADSVGMPMHSEEGTSKAPLALDLGSETSDSLGSSQNVTSSNRHLSSSATITITWTTAVPPEE